MNIALDYDGTFTSDPDLWLNFIVDARNSGHEVFIVTMRYQSEVEDGSIHPMLEMMGVKVCATNRKAKKPCAKAMGLPPIHVWIDDHPEAIHKDASAIWPDTAPEGEPIIPSY
jgi:hypothetical protein